jgi:hypothetical protein
MREARWAARLTWVYAAMFGIPVLPVAIFLAREHHLPSLLGLFVVYEGSWSERYSWATVLRLLIAFAAVLLLVSVVASSVWGGSRRGMVAALVLLPVEVVFWIGFSLPGPFVFAAFRLLLLLRAFRVPPRPSDQNRVAGVS